MPGSPGAGMNSAATATSPSDAIEAGIQVDGRRIPVRARGKGMAWFDFGRNCRDCGTQRPDRTARPDARRSQPATRVAVLVVVRFALAQSAGHRDIYHARFSGDRNCDPFSGAVCQQSGRTSTQSPTCGGAVRDRRIYGARALTYEGATAPWSPKMTAWSGDPVPEDFVRQRSPVELQGARRIPI